MNYSYSAENRLVTPCAYMYTAFGGPEFLTAYLQSRTRDCARIAAMLEDWRDLAGWGGAVLANWDYEPDMPEGEWGRYGEQLQTIGALAGRAGDQAEEIWKEVAGHEAERWELDEASLDRDISTDLLLNRLLNAALASRGQEGRRGPCSQAAMELLLQRFEVTKRIYPYYRARLRRGRGDHTGLSRYAAFAVLLAATYRATGNSRWLSCLLKVNDLLCSVLDDVMSDTTIAVATQTALLTEVTAVGTMMREGGINEAPF